MIKKKIFRRTAVLISLLVFLIVLILIFFSIKDHRRHVKEHSMSFGIVLAGELERLVHWDDRFALEHSLSRSIEANSVFSYIFIIKNGEIYTDTFNKPAPPGLVNGVSEYPKESYYWEFEDESGGVFYEAVVPVSYTDAFIRIGIKRRNIDIQLYPYIRTTVYLGLAVLFAGILFSYGIAVTSTKEIRLLSEVISSYQEIYDELPRRPSGGEVPVAELAGSFKRLVSERKKIEEQLERSLREKDSLLAEIYHRTGNNMQIISSLLSLQSRKAAGPEFLEMVEKVDCRIQAMAIAHQLMYESNDLFSIDISKYIADLSSFLFQRYSRFSQTVRLFRDVDGFNMAYDKAIPIGLILNELISNSLLHAFPSGSEGEIEIRLVHAGEGTLKFDYSDNGVGLPEGIDCKKIKDSLGLQIITILAEQQLGGRLGVDNSNGCSCSIEFDEAVFS